MFLGIGIGLILSSMLFLTFQPAQKLSDVEVEKRALKLGMKYPEDFKVINKDVKK